MTPDPINHKYYGRFNQGVVTISLPDVALSSGGDMNSGIFLRKDLSYATEHCRLDTIDLKELCLM